MVAQWHRVRGGISLSSEEEDKSDTGNDMNPDQADPDQTNDEYLVELWKGMRWKLQVTKWGYSSIYQVKCEIHSFFIHFIMRTTSEIFQ